MRKLFAFAALVGLTLGGSTAYAGTSTSTLTITATVTTSCTFAQPQQTLDFSSSVTSPTSVSNPETLGITCTSGYPYTVAASPGNTGTCLGGAGLYPRFLAAGALKISYAMVVIPPAFNWCDGTNATAVFSGVGNGSQQTISYNVNFPGWSADINNPNRPISAYPAGAYSDSVTLTATF